MNQQTKDIVVRAGKTFVQAFLSAWAVSGFEFDKGVIVGAFAAGISVVWNTFFPPVPVK